MRPALHLVTLGTRDLAVSRRFYEQLGYQISAGALDAHLRNQTSSGERETGPESMVRYKGGKSDMDVEEVG